MKSDANYLKILEKISDIQVKVGQLETGMANMSEDIREIKDEDRKQNQLLAEHIQGVKSNSERLTIEREARIEQHKQTLKLLEQHNEENREEFNKLREEVKPALFFPKLLTMTRKAILWVGAPAAAIYTIGKIIGWF